MFEGIDRAMADGVKETVFPGAVLLWGSHDTLCYHKGFGFRDFDKNDRVTKDTVYDLASLTKPLATALAAADMVKHQTLSLDTSLGEVLPQVLGTDKALITLDMLLRHTSGLPAHREFYRLLAQQGEESRNALRQLLLDEPLVSVPGERECYSDLGYMMLSWVLETVSGRRLDIYLAERIYRPLGVEKIGFIDLAQPVPAWARDAAPAMDCPWRQRVIRAEVEDENAWAAGGVEGHAGLFGTAGAVYRLCCEIMAALTGRGCKVLDPWVMAAFGRRMPGRTRAAGFDTPSGPSSAAGQYHSPKTLGHLGFTGTSFWINPDTGLIVVLLTNRVHPSRENLRIRNFRPLIHDLVSKAFERF